MGKIATFRKLLCVLGLIFAVQGTALLADDGAISGVIKGATGEPAAGAIVSAKNVDRGIAKTVYSQQGGRYTISNLTPGKYTVRALGGGLQSVSNDPMTLEAGQKLTVDLALTQDQNYRQASTAAHDLTMLPDGKEKVFIQRTCGLCHRMGFEEIVMSRRDHDGWMDIISKMRDHPFGNRGSADITDQERDMLVDYFTKNFGIDTPLLDEKKNMPRQWVTGPATKAEIVEIDLPKGAYPHDVDVDSKGTVWVSERDLGYVDRLDPVTLKYTRYKVPGDKVELSDAIATDAKGHPWVLDAGDKDLLEFNPDTQSFTAYPDKTPGSRISANTIRFQRDGTVWFTMTGSKKVGKFDLATKQYTIYSANLPPEEKRGGPYGMAVDGAGNIWFPEQDADTVGMIDVETGKVTTYNPPTPRSIPRRMGTDRDGNLWFAEFSGHNLVKIDYRTAKMTEYPTPTKYSTPYSVDSDNVDNLIWTSECYADQMARFDPASKTWVEYPFADHHMSIRRISVDPTMPNRVWFGEPAKDRIGYIEVPKQ